MSRDYLWLSGAQFAKISPFFPTDTRGVKRVHDRRVVSGIIHVLKSGGRWIDAPAFYGPRKTLYNRFVRWSAKDIWTTMFQALAAAGGPPAEVLLDSSAVKAHRSASGAKGGSKIRRSGARAAGEQPKSTLCRPLAFILTGGQVADCIAGKELLQGLASVKVVHADKGYDSNAIRAMIEARGALPNIPPKANRVWKNCFSPFLYNSRNAIERMFGRLKGFRRIATRYDRLARNYLSDICLAATVCYWL